MLNFLLKRDRNKADQFLMALKLFRLNALMAESKSASPRVDGVHFPTIRNWERRISIKIKR
jgi:hypothetical protein